MSKRPRRTEKSTLKLFHSLGYQIGKTIGQGTYSKVCIAIDDQCTKFACKIINKKYGADDFIEKFLPRELKIITTIKHPNIVTVYKVLEANHSVYMFMDYCKNGDLLEYTRIQGPFTEGKAKIFFRQIVDAVRYLHNQDIAHRDLKCENILLMANYQIKLGDFGFARYCKNKFGTNLLSDTFCGSTAYAAPEILQGLCYVPKMYDIWALGCILYVMMTALMPFDDTNVKLMIKDQISRSIGSSILLWNVCSTNLRKLQLALLEPDTSRRITINRVAKHPWFR